MQYAILHTIGGPVTDDTQYLLPYNILVCNV